MREPTRLMVLGTFGLLACMTASLPIPAAGQAPTSTSEVNQTPANSSNSSVPRRLPQYVLGPNDEIVILAVHADEIANHPWRVTTTGDVNLPLVGRIHAAGMTLEQFEGEVVERLKTYIKQPEVAVNITQFRSQPVSVMGAVGKPGVLQLEGTKRLIEVLSLAGGVTRDAGSRVKITRKLESGPIPLPSATVVGDYSLAEVDVRAIENATHPEENIEILPNDIISVPRAQLVYVIGEGVKQPGGFALNDRSSISLIEAVARAQGTVRGAALKSARIIRQGPGSNRVEIAVNMRDVYKGKGSDVMLQADDILYIPNNELKGTLRRSVDSVIQLSEAVVVYRGLGVY